MQRPFLSTDKHDHHIVWHHNQVVKNDFDHVIVVGDAVSKSAKDPMASLAMFHRMRGRKTLIRGNHDVIFTDEQLAPYFEKIVAEGEGIEMEYEGIPLFATHYPTCGKIDKFNLVGHIHGAWKFQLNMLNVGGDVHSFRPVNIDQIPFSFKAITEFYDRDVWVAYLAINHKFFESRGKKTSYFNP